MSPILFALYVNGLAEEIVKANIGARIVRSGEDRCGILLFADDIVLIAEDKANLDKLMNIAFQYSCKWRFNFNYDKCAVMVFNNRAAEFMTFGHCIQDCYCGYHWRLGKQLIKQVSVYKYLGIELDTQLSQFEFRLRLATKARMNVSKVWSMGMRDGGLSVKATVNLYEALVRSVLEYGAEVSSNTGWEAAERVQREIGRRILRCHGKTTNEAVLGELGWMRLQSRREYLKLKYWIKISLMDETRLVRKVYRLSRKQYRAKGVRNWCHEIHNLLKKYGLHQLWTDENLIKEPAEVAPAERTTPRIKKHWEGVLFKSIQWRNNNGSRE